VCGGSKLKFTTASRLLSCLEPDRPDELDELNELDELDSIPARGSMVQKNIHIALGYVDQYVDSLATLPDQPRRAQRLLSFQLDKIPATRNSLGEPRHLIIWLCGSRGRPFSRTSYSSQRN
jgi:hypothetical protein